MDFFEETVETGFDASGKEFGRVGFSDKPIPIAAFNLFKVLGNYPQFTKEDRLNLQNEFADFPNLSVINLESFASVLAFLNSYPEPTPINFKDKNIMPFLTRLLPTTKMTKAEKKKYVIRLKGQFLKYIIAINNYREYE